MSARKLHGWIGGWGIAETDFQQALERAYPETAHWVTAPTPGALERLLQRHPDCIGGYSLGTLLLLDGIERLPQSAPLTLLAPIRGFCKEHGLGGTTPEATLRTLIARCERKPETALKLFYKLSGVRFANATDLPYAHESLVWGLHQLLERTCKTTPPGEFHALVGAGDPLMDPAVIQMAWHERVTIRPCGHDYAALLQIHDG